MGAAIPEERRLFIGLSVDEEAGRRLLRGVRPFLEGSKAQIYAPEDLHLTLGFLGSFPENQRRHLQRVLQEEIRGLEAPELILGEVGAYPSLAEPATVWARVYESDERPGRLWALRNRVWQAALCQGWRPPDKERRAEFRPHVTVARLPPSDPGPALDPGLARLELDQRWLPVDVHIWESHASHQGERYRSLAAVPLVVRPG